MRRARAPRSARRVRRPGFAVKTPSLDQEVGKLSGGNQQKVVLARWLAAKPAGADPRRADPRHRCRRQGRDLPPDRRARERGARDHVHLVRAARDPRPVATASTSCRTGRITGELQGGGGVTEEKVLALAMVDHLPPCTEQPKRQWKQRDNERAPAQPRSGPRRAAGPAASGVVINRRRRRQPVAHRRPRGCSCSSSPSSPRCVGIKGGENSSGRGRT